ncbi:deoxyguanosinetriphosphate triphosphohydrolase [Parasphingopyxis sp. CP4]|uniref:deoxyguanosinetriphosphate triphosphohydrolase n=1 Tax=Parasphingopyxis sp. CP4 TaxID=2724527 RepID=UPI0015A2CB56|nr:deoxyguanosinetriphosphate triphosphohydrolase [Parasphingopyxis sp. CP4]QLC20707.1 deoxyguanosinetriphosphate triphosphohydrolase [Parasphingopyxis sp. CP4]
MTLASYASHPAISRGRQHDERRDETRGPRDIFQRDRDRIIHSVAFRRLRGKTQVFVAPDGDHFRVRLTHSMEVAQIGRTIARVLGLNEDLTEAICLAHDIGHPPFGHAGEDALKAALADNGGFDHNAQTLRMLTQLERRYPRFAGLNLSWETLEGLAKHNGPVSDPPWALAKIDAEYPLELQTFASLEAQVAALADDIAYDNHDIDDGLRAGLFDRDQLLATPGLAELWEGGVRRFPNAGPELLASELIREQIGMMVNDLISETKRRIQESGIASSDDARGAGRPLVGFSPAMAEHERGLKRFLYAHMYEHPKQEEVATAVRGVVAGLFAAYHGDPALIPDNWRASLPENEPARSRHIADFIAGMTDSFAIRAYRAQIGPIDLPEGF